MLWSPCARVYIQFQHLLAAQSWVSCLFSLNRASRQRKAAKSRRKSITLSGAWQTQNGLWACIKSQSPSCTFVWLHPNVAFGLKKKRSLKVLCIGKGDKAGGKSELAAEEGVGQRRGKLYKAGLRHAGLLLSTKLTQSSYGLMICSSNGWGWGEVRGQLSYFFLIYWFPRNPLQCWGTWGRASDKQTRFNLDTEWLWVFRFF